MSKAVKIEPDTNLVRFVGGQIEMHQPWQPICRGQIKSIRAVDYGTGLGAHLVITVAWIAEHKNGEWVMLKSKENEVKLMLYAVDDVGYGRLEIIYSTHSGEKIILFPIHNTTLDRPQVQDR